MMVGDKHVEYLAALQVYARIHPASVHSRFLSRVEADQRPSWQVQSTYPGILMDACHDKIKDEETDDEMPPLVDAEDLTMIRETQVCTRRAEAVLALSEPRCSLGTAETGPSLAMSSRTQSHWHGNE